MKVSVAMLVILGTLGGLSVPGCTTYRDPATGAEATYIFETLKARLNLEIGPVYAAAEKAVQELHLRLMRQAEDGISAEIRAIDSHYQTVDIRLAALPQGRTLLTIRVGVIGDKDKSIVLFEQIMRNLSQAEQQAAAPVVQWGDWALSLEEPGF
jgi:hypothetical protein